MREINISKIILEKRKEKGITQDELAEYIGVSKASVSKWETAQSYPDITLLPYLATYFNISIDQLIGYLPQMTKEDIKKTYNRLADDFASKPFEEVYDECQILIKKYYSCFPLLFQMSALLLNHYKLIPESEKQESIVNEIILLCKHIKKECDDVWLAKQANSLEAIGYLLLQKPSEVIDLLDGTIKPIQADEVILSSAYQMSGNIDKAKSVLQISLFQYILNIMDFASTYLSLYMLENDKFEIVFDRFISISKIFDIEKLRPDLLLKIYYVAALQYLNQKDEVKALEMLNNYLKASLSDNFAVFQNGDKFFDSIEDWFVEFDINKKAPRDIKLIKEDVLKMVKDNPAFAVLSSNVVYKNIIQSLELNLKES